MSPYQALYGVKPPLLPAYVPGGIAVEEVDELLKKPEEVHQRLKLNLQRAQER